MDEYAAEADSWNYRSQSEDNDSKAPPGAHTITAGNDRPTEDITSKKVSPKSVWQGRETQREMLYDALAAASFIENSPDGRSKFFNNQTVKWLENARLLYYMLQQLKETRFKFIRYSENWVPLVNGNFVDSNGNPFKNVAQNISGMKTSNKDSKPRFAERIDKVLEPLAVQK